MPVEQKSILDDDFFPQNVCEAIDGTIAFLDVGDRALSALAEVKGENLPHRGRGVQITLKALQDELEEFGDLYHTDILWKRVKARLRNS